VLDPDRINDRADFSNPRLLASGILAVFVNGHIAYSPDTKSIARHGRMIRRSDFL
jgi:N-acyl-D-aspartate/D-glutamate deacylase